MEELKAVFDPTGGYLKKGGKFMPSIVAEIGDCLETHLKSTGLVEDQQLEHYQQAHLQEKKAEFESLHGLEPSAEHNFPEGAQLCRKCYTMAAVRLDNCLTCLNCGDSKCG